MEQGIPSGAVFKVKICSSEKQLDEITKDELIEFVRFGNAVASLCVEKRGAIPAMPDLLQVEERLTIKSQV